MDKDFEVELVDNPEKSAGTETEPCGARGWCGVDNPEKRAGTET